MTFIAKAMNKQTRLDAETERAARQIESGAAVSDASPKSNPREAAPESEFEFVPIHEPSSPEASEKPSKPSPRDTAWRLSPTGSRSRSNAKSEVPKLEFIGTLESIPPELEAEEPLKRPWWREPMVIGGGALGLAALLLGFLVSPGNRTGTDSAEVVGPNEAALQTLLTSDAPPEVQASDNKPVVVRVQIESGDGGSVEFETGGSSAGSMAPMTPLSSIEPVTPKMPEYFEPLQPLELPPPPSMDLTVDDPVPSIPNRSRYEEPPPSGDAISDYRLEGIFWSPSDPGAIINDEIVSPGSRVDQLRVLEIQKDHVLVQLHGRTYDLR